MEKNEASRQMGSTLLQTTMHESSTQTFIEHYSTWFARLLALVKGQPSASLLQSLWTALATLFGKVGQLLAVAGVRREGSGMVAKLLPTLLPLLEHPGGGAADVAMAHALHAALIALPSACRAHLKPLEQYASQAVLADTGSTELQRVAAACLAALPGVTGDAASWSAMVQRLLVTLHDTLDTAFMGMDDAGLRGAARAALDPGAISLAGPASAAALLGASQHTTAAALKRLAGLLDCLERLMTQGYPVAVPLPSNGILLLLTRILSMDDSTGRQPPSASAYLELCGQLPELHATALELLITLLRAGRGALTPLFASMCRLMGDLMRRIAAGGTASFTTIAWTVRQGVYKTAAELERQAHAGAGSRLAAEALAAAVLELYGPQQTRSTGGGEPGPRKRQKKAKAREEGLDGLATGQMVASAGAAVQVPSFIGWQRELAVQQASLGLLEVILKVTGSSLPGPQRVQLDSVVVHVANTAVQKLGQEPESGGREGPVAELQLAAYRALLASVVAPSAHRPPFLPQALALFRQGLHASSPALAQLCRQALISESTPSTCRPSTPGKGSAHLNWLTD
ncbi:hypothetical protein WJX72_011546 [[Myrmecia] bisecta]|uniref:Pre-rRNA-processing protein RIX1 N-terminal domain-containing protein n=1 Tax=[Myrmecia] bisecta TaxID=41462 RepID=A0AAW1PKS1_9CHLO